MRQCTRTCVRACVCVCGSSLCVCVCVCLQCTSKCMTACDSVHLVLLSHSLFSCVHTELSRPPHPHTLPRSQSFSPASLGRRSIRERRQCSLVVTTGREDKAGGNVERRRQGSKGAGGGAQVGCARRPSVGGDEDWFSNQHQNRKPTKATSPLWFEDEAAGWMLPGDLLKRNS